MKKLTVVDMVEKFQCPGCVSGSDTTCGNYVPVTQSGFSDDAKASWCDGHTLGTSLFGSTGMLHMALGLPKGFNRSGQTLDIFNAHFKEGPHKGRRKPNTASFMEIRLWLAGQDPGWDEFNIPVWAMVEDGFLFVRTVCPRTARVITDVIEGGTLDMVPNAVDVGKFVDEID